MGRNKTLNMLKKQGWEIKLNAKGNVFTVTGGPEVDYEMQKYQSRTAGRLSRDGHHPSGQYRDLDRHTRRVYNRRREEITRNVLQEVNARKNYGKVLAELVDPLCVN
jgi:hypothetical protein